MHKFYYKKANLSLMRTQCAMELSKMKLNRNTPGGPIKLFQEFQGIYLDFENVSGSLVSDDEKIGTLNDFI